MSEKHFPVPQAVLNLLALEGYEAVHSLNIEDEWTIRRISDRAGIATWKFDSQSMNYVREITRAIADHRERIRLGVE